VLNAIANLSNQTDSSFNITWSKIDTINATIAQNNQNLTTLLYYVAGVANGSVDRNDSYLAHLMRGIAVATGAPVTGVLNVTVAAQTPVYFNVWRVEAQVVNEYGQVVGPPLVHCTINTNNDPPAANASMRYVSGAGSVLTQDTGVFFYQENIVLMGDHSYAVNCSYNAVI
jgi:hypothetical protein